MRIHVFSPIWNEEYLLPYYLRHYQQFAQKITLFDNGCTDRSVEIARAAGVEVRKWSTGGLHNEEMMRDLKNECWKECRDSADWTIVCDIDELIYHPDIVSYLARMKEEDVTIPQPMGFQMLAHEPPKADGQFYDEVKIGKYCREYESKMAVFDPNEIAEIGYYNGAHHAEPRGYVNIRWPSELKLLHARFLGVDYVYERCQRIQHRLHPRAIEPGWWDYSWSREHVESVMKEYWHNAQVVV